MTHVIDLTLADPRRPGRALARSANRGQTGLVAAAIAVWLFDLGVVLTHLR